MSSSWQTPGLLSTSEYQSSGYPFILPAGNTARTVTLNYVSRAVTIITEEADVTVTFTDEGSNARTINLKTVGSYRFEIRCTGFETNAKQCSAVVECTGIPVAHLNGAIVQPLYTKLGSITT